MTPPKPMEVILAETAAVFNVSVAEILSEKRDKKLTAARHAAIMMAREFPRYSLTRIGRIMNRDHTSIRYGHLAGERRNLQDKQFSDQIDELSARLRIKFLELGS